MTTSSPSLTPPSLNPNGFISYYPKRKLWRNAQEIHPGYWLVEECAGPRAKIASLAVVKYLPSVMAGRSEWVYVGTVGRRHTLEIGWLGNRSWKIYTGSEHQDWLASELVRLVKEFG